MAEKKESRNWWDRIPIKEILLIVLGAVITLFFTEMANHSNNTEQFDKEFREKRNSYIDGYLKELNQRYYLFVQLVDEDANISESKEDSLRIQSYAVKLEETRTNLNINSFYDSVQFSRYNKGRYYDELKQINSTFNEYAQHAEANDKSYIDVLKEQQSQILNRINNIEKEIYKNIDQK